MKTNKLTFIAAFLLVIIINLSCQKNEVNQQNLQKSENFISERKVSEAISKLYWNNQSSQKKTTVPLLNKAVKEIVPVLDDNSETAFYVINYENGGFIVLSADNRVSPILAYSETNSFRTAKDVKYNSGLEDWMNMNKEYVKAVRNKNIEQTPEIKRQWENLSIGLKGAVQNRGEGEGPSFECESKVITEIGPLLSTTWNQDCGYNDLMPSTFCSTVPCGDNNNAYAGCVPVAIAQVMKYHNYPSSYSWSSMPSTTGSATTSQLIRDIWDVIPSGSKSIDCDGTLVYNSYNIASVFTSFGYSSATKASYNSSTLSYNISNTGPVILSGATSTLGHMWVADGISEYMHATPNGSNCSWMVFKYEHMNWGWGGYEDGWYTQSVWNPAVGSFTLNRQMVYNIIP